jgi:glutamate synthase (NADPH/NADH) small chain
MKKAWPRICRADQALRGRKRVVTGLECVRVEWEGGKMVEVPGSEFTLKADLILLAMGFVGRASGSARSGRRDAGRARQCEGRHQHYRTSDDKIFACGDMRRGQSGRLGHPRRPSGRPRGGRALMGVTELPR